MRFLKPHTLYNIDGTKEEFRDYAEHSVIYSCEDNPNTYYLACWIDQGKFLVRDTTANPDPKSRDAYRNAIQQLWNEVGGKNNLTLSNDYCVR